MTAGGSPQRFALRRYEHSLAELEPMAKDPAADVPLLLAGALDAL